MQTNYYFLRQLSISLDRILEGTVISECFSQNKDELIIRFETHARPFYLKASLESYMSLLSFPEKFERARKNSIDLFSACIGYRVKQIRQYMNERCFALVLEDNRLLLFKMHGNRSNIIFFVEGRTPELFKSKFPTDVSLDPQQLDRQIDWSWETYANYTEKPELLYFTFGKVVWAYLNYHGFQSADRRQQWEMVNKTRELLENPSYYVTELKNVIHLTLLPFENSRKISDDLITASNIFFFEYTHEAVLQREKATILSRLKTRLAASENYLTKTAEKLADIERDTNYKTWADLLMANMHDIKPGMEKVTLPDFYHEGKVIDIKLKKDLNPQQNAALFYKKAKNQHIEIQRLNDALASKKIEMSKFREQMSLVAAINTLKELREVVSRFGLNAQTGTQQESLPFHEFVHNGFRIWVGKNAQDNDTLTFRHSYKEDLWLHAKDVAGSHVLVKFQAGKKFPKDVIERAGQLAAYNSKRKTETLCPVSVTPKKFVRKRKGDPPGTVVVEREEVIMVEPML